MKDLCAGLGAPFLCSPLSFIRCLCTEFNAVNADSLAADDIDTFQSLDLDVFVESYSLQEAARRLMTKS